jgi:hypothetical protein
MPLEAYCDETESSAEGKPLLLLAGYVGDVETWQKFTSQWQEQILERYQIPFFHAKELRSGNNRFYKHLSIHKRQALLDEAIDIISNVGIESTVVVFLRPSDWKAVTTPEERSIWGSAYRIAAEYLLIGFGRAIGSTEFGNEPALNIFVEDGHANSTDAIKGIKGWKLRSQSPELPEALTPDKYDLLPPAKFRQTAWSTPQIRVEGYGLVSKKLVKPVQAADLLACVAGVTIRNQVDQLFNDGILKKLVSKNPMTCRISPLDCTQLINQLRQGKHQIEEGREAAWEANQKLRDQGFVVYDLPGVTLIDRNPTGKNKDTDPIHVQARAIQKKFKEHRKNGY